MGPLWFSGTQKGCRWLPLITLMQRRNCHNSWNGDSNRGQLFPIGRMSFPVKTTTSNDHICVCRSLKRNQFQRLEQCCLTALATSTVAAPSSSFCARRAACGLLAASCSFSNEMVFGFMEFHGISWNLKTEHDMFRFSQRRRDRDEEVLFPSDPVQRSYFEAQPAALPR